jgi:hypothetical protein
LEFPRLLTPALRSRLQVNIETVGEYQNNHLGVLPLDIVSFSMHSWLSEAIVSTVLIINVPQCPHSPRTSRSASIFTQLALHASITASAKRHIIGPLTYSAFNARNVEIDSEGSGAHTEIFCKPRRDSCSSSFPFMQLSRPARDLTGGQREIENTFWRGKVRCKVRLNVLSRMLMMHIYS